MNSVTTANNGLPQAERPLWGAVFAMVLCVAVLIASEFMPVSLLSPIAHDLRLSEGKAGQAIGISGLFAVVTSLFITVLAGRIDRRVVLIALTGLMVVSGTIVSFAPNYLILMAGRALIGIAIGGFWSMSAATVMRLVPAMSVPKGLALLNSGTALASTIAAPLVVSWAASSAGGVPFFCVVPMAVAALIWQALTLPPLPVEGRSEVGGVLKLFRHRQVALGMLAVSLTFMGQFALFTYLRPFLEQVSRVNVSMLSAMLLIVGLAGLVGNFLVGKVLGARLHATLALIPVMMAAVAVALAAFGSSPWTTAVLLALWGMLGAAMPVAWGTWLTQTLPADAEAGGGLMVAIIQLGITVGATVGGLVFDSQGARVTFFSSSGILVLAGLAAFAASKECSRQHGLRPDTMTSSILD